MKATTRSDQLPATVQHHFLQQLGKRSLFWRELFEVSLHLGLRNVEARELTADMVDLDKKTLHLFDSKQVRSHITKQANKWLDASWLKAGKKLVRIELKAQSEDALAALVTTAAVDSVVALDDIADQFDIGGYQAAKEAHYAQHIEQARQEAARTAPSGRIVDLSPFPGVISILRKRIANLQPGNSLLFPANELNSNRARGQGFEPVSRQSAKRIVDIVAAELRSMKGKISAALKGIRLGLHSCRKAAVQRVVEVAGDVMAASIWIGHGCGSGDLATTQNYLDRSAQKMADLSKRLLRLNEGAAA